MKICVINQKGGTGKTTTAIHLAAALAKRGSKCLLVDCDPQGSVAVSLRLASDALADLFLGDKEFEEVIQTLNPQLSVISSNARLMEVENRLHQNSLSKSELFKSKLKADRFDHIVLDMAPSRSLLNEAALFFADEILIPVACDYLSLVGVRDVLEFVSKVSEEKGSEIKLRSLVPTMYDTRSKISHESCTLLEKHFPSQVASPIRHSTKAKEAPSYGKTLFDYAPSSTSARDYLKLAELLN